MVCEAPSLSAAITETLGDPVQQLRPLSGGAGGDAYAVTLRSGAEVFIKVGATGPAELFAAEAHGLRWLAAAEAIAIPSVIAVRTALPCFIALPLIVSATPALDYDEQLGHQLATLHQATPPRFGLAHDNFIGPLPQCNAPSTTETFAAFFRERRLQPLVRHLSERNACRRQTLHAVDRVAARLEALIPEEPPARLHGDLWSGNVMVGAAGQPVLIDPSVYGGHREIDLAMLCLFGRVPARTLGAYQEVVPLASGFAERTALWQLYPLLVHLVLFGTSYEAQVAAAAAQYQ